MQFFRYNCGGWKAAATLSECYQPDRCCPRRFSFVGGGGKTSAIFKMAEELSGLSLFFRLGTEKRKVLIAPTTKMYLPRDGCVLLSPRLCEVREALAGEPYVVIGQRAALADSAFEPKIEGLPSSFLEEAAMYADVVLTEADGARHMPAKAPAEHEPVLFPGTTDVAAVMGLDCLYRPVREVCHRPELVCRILGVSPEHLLTPEEAARLLMSEKGQRKDVGTGQEFYVLLNKADGPEQLCLAGEVAKNLESMGCRHIAASSLSPAEG